MDIRIGIKSSPREIELQLPEDSNRDDVRLLIEEALSEPGRVLWLTDKKGREVAVPSTKISYVEMGSTEDARRMGFSS